MIKHIFTNSFGILVSRILGFLRDLLTASILGANIFKDFFAGIRDIVGGRSSAYEKELRQAKDIALEEMKAEAANLGGNAVIAIDLDYETVGQGSMLMVTASGTAVTIQD